MELVNPFLTKNPPGGVGPTVEAHGGSNPPPGPKADSAVKDEWQSDDYKPPMPWFGGKSRAASLVWERFGNVPNYCEPFFGSGAVLFARPTQPGTETVNDLDGYVANFWRAVKADPGAVAEYADNPVNERDLEARHQWLVTEGRRTLDAVLADPDGYDAKIAGWWCWGQCAWIGSGWCSGNGPWTVVDGQWTTLRNPGQGVNRQLPHLGDPGKGVNRQLPHLGDPGKGTCELHRDHLVAYFRRIADRLRYVRVACGQWNRILTPSVTFRFGLTGVLLDPPYATGEVDYTAGGNTDAGLVGAVRQWAIDNGDNLNLRIALCGYEGEFEMPDDWSVAEWTAAGGYSSTAAEETHGQRNRHRERIWFSPHCLKTDKPKQLELLP
jgi:DNA adenine methylase